MRIGITGAAGFIGSHVCERLLADGHAVRGVDAFTRFYARELKEANLAGLRSAPGFELRELNLLDHASLPPAFAELDAVCHLAGRPGVRRGSPAVYQAGNVRTTEAVIGAAARAGVRRVLLASSSSVYGCVPGRVAEDAPLLPLSHYGLSKRRAEQVARRLARRHGIELVVLRYFTVYGPRQRPDMAFSRFVSAALDGGRVPLLGDGAQVRDFTYVGDAAEATALALAHGADGAAYNVSGGRPAALSYAFGLLAGHLGRNPPLEERPPDDRDPRNTAADLSRARRELGWEPRTELAEGLGLQAAHAASTLAAV
ncbi:MAG TPA: NAD-dependent epimerase/dehydratase family protein [Thermoleophilaceae bacterium]|nr:NAD-dependent epimerase/dehydratase family protein [Thermoleophilaceae bacterium]